MSDHGRGEHSGHDVGDTPPDSGEREVPYYEVLNGPRMVSLPLLLAQRILAELERVITSLPSEDFRRGTRILADELRKYVECSGGSTT